MQHTKVSYELTQNYISSPRDTEKDSPDPASAIEKRISCGMKPTMLKSALKGR